VFRRISTAFKEAFWGIKHHFAMAFSTANAVTLTILLLCVFMVLITNISQITSDVEEDIQIYAPIQEEVSDEEILSLQTKIEKIPGVTKVTYRTKDQELDSLIASFNEDGNLFEIYRDDNPLPRVFLINIEQGYSLDQISTQVTLIEGMAEANYGGATIDDFVKLLTGIRRVGTLFILALTALAIFLISNTIKITINSRKEELGIMRLVGASNASIAAPLVIEGVFIGIMGSIVPIIVTVLGYKFIYEKFDGQIISGILKLIPVYPFVINVSIFALVVAILVGFVGSFLSAQRYLRYKR